METRPAACLIAVGCLLIFGCDEAPPLQKHAAGDPVEQAVEATNKPARMDEAEVRDLREEYLDGQMAVSALLEAVLDEKASTYMVDRWNWIKGSIRDEDFAEALQFLIFESNFQVRSRAVGDLIRQAGERNPILAQELIGSIRDARLRDVACVALMSTKESALANAAFLATISADEMRVWVDSAAIEEMLGTATSAELVEMSVALPEGPFKNKVDAFRASALAAGASDVSSLDRALINDGLERYHKSAYERLLRERSAEDVKEMVAALKVDEVRSSLVWVAARRIAAQTGDLEAARWLEGLPPELDANVAVSSSISSWLDRDSESASQFIREMEAGPRKDEAIRMMVQFLRRPEEAELRQNWIEQVSNEELRNEIKERLRAFPDR